MQKNLRNASLAFLVLAIFAVVGLQVQAAVKVVNKDPDLIKKVFINKYKNNKVTVKNLKIEKNFARGIVINGKKTITFLATKANGKWTIVFDKAGNVDCKIAVAKKFPKGLVQECYKTSVNPQNKPVPAKVSSSTIPAAVAPTPAPAPVVVAPVAPTPAPAPAPAQPKQEWKAVWTAEALEYLQEVPWLFRTRVKGKLEEKAKAENVMPITKTFCEANKQG